MRCVASASVHSKRSLHECSVHYCNHPTVFIIKDLSVSQDGFGIDAFAGHWKGDIDSIGNRIVTVTVSVAVAVFAGARTTQRRCHREQKQSPRTIVPFDSVRVASGKGSRSRCYEQTDDLLDCSLDWDMPSWKNPAGSLFCCAVITLFPFHTMVPDPMGLLDWEATKYYR